MDFRTAIRYQLPLITVGSTPSANNRTKPVEDEQLKLRCGQSMNKLLNEIAGQLELIDNKTAKEAVERLLAFYWDLIVGAGSKCFF